MVEVVAAQVELPPHVGRIVKGLVMCQLEAGAREGSFERPCRAFESSKD